jgi:hypothetical protein
VLSNFFYSADLIIGFGLPVYILLRFRAAEKDPSIRRLFWLGVAVGLVWEVPIFLSACFGTLPVLVFLRKPPFHPLILLVSHSFWDGGLFLVGVALLRAVFGNAILQRIRLSALVVFLLWGQVSALLIEMASVTSGGWAYVIPHPWNVELFEIAGHPITLLPQLIWLVAPIAYCVLARPVSRRLPSR